MARDSKCTYTTTLGEVIRYPRPSPEVEVFLRRATEAAEDPRVSHDDMINLVYGEENPLLTKGTFKGRGAVTKETIANPLWPVFLDLLQHKEIALGRVTPQQLLALFSMTVSEAAAQLAMTPDGVLKAIRAGKLVSLKKANGYLLDPRSVNSFGLLRKPRGFAKGPALRLAFGNAPGQSFRVKFADMRLGEASKLKDGKLRYAEVDSFKRAAFMITGKIMHRTFILEPASRRSEYRQGPFYIEGRFKFTEKINNATDASRAFRDFEPS